MIKKPLEPGEKRERKDNQMMIKIFIGMVILISVLILLFDSDAMAGGNHIITINNYYEKPAPPDPPPITEMKITSGISGDELGQGIATAAAIGALGPFDYSTIDYQWAASGSYETGNDQNAYAAGIMKRWEGIDAAWGIRFSQQGDDEVYVFTVGGRF